MPDSVLQARALRKNYRSGDATLEVLRGVDLALVAGESISIRGESGSGKSTLLNLLAGLDRPDRGRVLLDGHDLSALDDDAVTVLRRRAVGFVFQAFHVLPYLSVAENVALPLDLLGVREPERSRRASLMLAAVGLSGLSQRHARELSGGEVQRVAIARAVVHGPRLLLADEPTGNLDPRTAAQTLLLLRAQVKANAGAGLLITHSRTAAETADRILVLDARGLRPSTSTDWAATDGASTDRSTADRATTDRAATGRAATDREPRE
jgi:putative ABC transport system ATP-binding protein